MANNENTNTTLCGTMHYTIKRPTDDGIRIWLEDDGTIIVEHRFTSYPFMTDKKYQSIIDTFMTTPLNIYHCHEQGHKNICLRGMVISDWNVCAKPYTDDQLGKVCKKRQCICRLVDTDVDKLVCSRKFSLSRRASRKIAKLAQKIKDDPQHTNCAAPFEPAWDDFLYCTRIATLEKNQ